MPEFDAIIIGTGQAGPSLAHRLAAAGQRVAIVERHRFGGTCVNTGCTPTKTLVASAYAAHLARRAAEFGVSVPGPVTVDMKKVKARKDYVLGFSTRGVERSLRSNPMISVYQGHARFASASSVAVGSETLSAPKIFINVGGRAFVPDIPGLDEVTYFTNSTMLDVDFVPPHLIVVGGSYIGLEFAQIFRRFGSEVTVIEMAPRLIPREDEDTSAAVADILKAEGIGIHVGVGGLKFAKARQGNRRELRLRRRRQGDHRYAYPDGRRSPPQHRRPRPRQGGRRDRQARVHRGRRPAAHQRARHLGARRLQWPRCLYAHLLQRLRDRRRQPARQRSAPRQRPHRRLQPLHRSAAGPRRPHRGGGAQVRPARTDGQDGHGGRGPRLREGRDAGLHEDPGRCRDQAVPGRLDTGRRRRRGRSTPFSTSCTRRRPTR